MMDVRLGTGSIVRACFVVLLILLVGHVLVQLVRFGLGHDSLLGVVSLFSFYEEANLPTWASSLLLFGASLILAAIGLATRAEGSSRALHWLGLAAIFLFLSADEVADIHPIAGRLISQGGDVSGSFIDSTWIIPYAGLVVVVGIVYLPFLFSLPRRTIALFVLSAAGYVMGTIGMELIEDRYMLTGGAFDAGFMVLVTIEELLEMGSIVLFLYACLDYQRRRFGGIRIVLSS